MPSATLIIVAVIILAVLGAWLASVRLAKKAALGQVSQEELDHIKKINDNNLRLQAEYAEDKTKLGNRPADDRPSGLP